jgi:HPt (histidine-containing phosphotransfer) domain-containing protein
MKWHFRDERQLMNTYKKTAPKTWASIITFIVLLILAIQFSSGVLQLISTISIAFFIGVLVTRAQFQPIDTPIKDQKIASSKVDIKKEKKSEQDNYHVDETISESPTLQMQTMSQNEEKEEDEPSMVLIDEKIIQQIIKDTDASVMPELIKFYLIESKERVETITNAAHTKDLYVLEFEAHTLGSSSLTLGNAALSAIARQIELHCIQHQFDDALAKARLLPDIAQESFLALEQRNALGFTN